MKYTNFKNYVNNKLNTLKEDLIRDVNIPSNTITYDGIIGSYIINPFAAYNYSFIITFCNETDLNDFIKEFDKSDLKNLVSDDTMVDINPVVNHYEIKGFFNKAALNDIQAEFKRILNKFKD